MATSGRGRDRVVGARDRGARPRPRCSPLRWALPILGIALVLFPPEVGSTALVVDGAVAAGAIEAQMDKHALRGVAVAIVEGDEVVHLAGYGTAGGDRAMTPQTQMFIGSQSKSFTALAVAQLADRGALDIDAPVRTYLPWFRVGDEEASARITIDHLVHHTSGLSDAGFGTLLPRHASLHDAVRALARAQPTAPVGAEFQYFNLGYTVLALIVEEVSGEAYADYLQEHIFEPLGMDDTTADPTTARDLAQGHTRVFGFPVPVSQPVPTHAIGAGYIVSTAEDMAAYVITIKDGGVGLVSEAMWRRMLTPGLGGYGFGWVIVDEGAKVLHGGANEAFRTDVNLYPRRDRAFVVLGNQGHQVDHFVSAVQLADTVEALTLGGEVPPVSRGWSVRWMGWVIGALVAGLVVLHVRNFAALGTWAERARRMSSGRRAWDIATSFLIPTVILVIVLTRVAAFYGDRFNLLTSMVYLRTGMPDVFVLMVVGVVPDYVQGVVKLVLWRRESRSGVAPATSHRV